MSLMIDHISRFRIFDFLLCPVCGHDKFESFAYTGVACENCCADFRARYTAGDPGISLSVYIDHVYGPAYDCPKCERQTAFLTPPEDACECGGEFVRKEGYQRPLSKPKDWVENEPYYSGTFKEGDSHYKFGRWSKTGHVPAPFNRTQEEWDEYQEVTECRPRQERA